MNIFISGLAYMDYRGEQINDVVFLKRITELFNLYPNVNTNYLARSSSQGINQKLLFDRVNIQSEYIDLDKVSRNKKYFKKYEFEDIKKIAQRNMVFSSKMGYEKKIEDILFRIIKLLNRLHEIHESKPMDRIIVFGDSLDSETIRMFATVNNISCFSVENGYFRPFTLQIDPKGVNAFNSVPRNKEFYNNIEIDHDRLNNFLFRPEKAKLVHDEIDSIRKIFLSYYEGDSQTVDSKEKIENSNLDEGDSLKFDSYIYVPLQLETDLQMIKNSSYDSLLEVVNDIDRFYKSMQLSKQNLKLVFKFHPLWTSEQHLRSYQKVKNKIDKHPYMYLVDDDNQILLKNAKAIMVVNSTVGFEAITLKKPVITFGEAFYNIDGIVMNVRKNQSININEFYEYLKNGPDPYLVNKFVYYTRFNYFFEVYRTGPDTDSLRDIVQYIISLRRK